VLGQRRAGDERALLEAPAAVFLNRKLGSLSLVT
jgi:hypothetical protein